jgi:chondroitin 4-sulfotransferase 11
MINHKHKFIFIHIPKTGGTSIEKVFKKDVGGAFERERTIKYKHQNAKGMQKLFPIEWGEYFKFALVRNPFDLLVSRYFWSRDVQQLESFKEKSFSEYIIAVNYHKLPEWTIPKCQYNYLSVNGEVAMDFIGRFENLQEDFNTIWDKIGIPRQEIPHVNKSKHKHYTEYYNEETKQIVAEKYAKDIEYFGYKFGE